MRRASRSRAITMVAAAAIVAVGIRCTEYNTVETEARDGGAGVVDGGEGGQQTDGPADAADAADADASACHQGLVLLGRFAITTGKVNVHTPASIVLSDKNELALNGWFADPDCASGADQDDLAYCKRFWPASTERLGPFDPDTTLKPFVTAGCMQQTAMIGREVFLCCGKAQ